MSVSQIVNTSRAVWRSLLAARRSDNHGRTRTVIKNNLKFLTAVSGYDHKSTPYKLQLKQKWIYGDDACFIASNEDFDVLGVADGVGGWRSYGINPGNFSLTLMRICENVVQRNCYPAKDPVQFISRCFEEIEALRYPVMGSATVCILTLSRAERMLYTANLGDSGFLVVRKDRLVMRSQGQQHAFNTPFQLSLPPPCEPGRFHMDKPENASRMQVAVEPGDYVVLSTDGLFDNVPDPMIVEEVVSIRKACVEDLKACADRLVKRARDCSTSRNSSFVPPIAAEAKRHGLHLNGGKPGDITVIVGLIIDEEAT